MDKDKIKQTPGPNQGNIHKDADEGRNEEQHPGSTLNKMPAINPEIETSGTGSRQGAGDSGHLPDGSDTTDSDQDTLGNP